MHKKPLCNLQAWPPSCHHSHRSKDEKYDLGLTRKYLPRVLTELGLYSSFMKWTSPYLVICPHVYHWYYTAQMILDLVSGVPYHQPNRQLMSELFGR